MVGSRAGRGAVLGLAVIVLLGAEVRPSVDRNGDERVADDVERPEPPALSVAFSPEAFGASGVLRVIQAMPAERFALPLAWDGARPAGAWYRWAPRSSKELAGKAAPSVLGAGDEAVAPTTPGVYHLEVGVGQESRVLDELSLVVKVPFRHKENGYVKGYLIGRYPTEGQRRRDAYAPPEGFIEVTRETRDLPLSEHFTLGEFLTKNQQKVWPKFVVVDMKLVEKLELVLQELNAMGVRADDMVIMSGYRTPQYNGQGLGAGRASLSRHQFGDAADVWVENDGDWYMDDLNGDGRKDTGDARVILEAVNRVEARHPELVGGAGIYRDNGVHGPFIHIDTRGKRARW